VRVNRPEMAWYLEEYHGVSVPSGRQPKIRCPFHDDRTPSANVYRDTERLVCYSGCFDSRAVDVLDIEMSIHGLTFPQAVEKVQNWPGTLVDAAPPTGAGPKGWKERQKRKPFSFKILEG
jgi:DNA primase